MLYLKAYSGSFPIGSTPHVTGPDIKKWRKRVELSQGDLAYHMGVSIRTLRHWENRDWPIPSRSAARDLKYLMDDIYATFEAD